MSDKSPTENIQKCGARVWHGFSDHPCPNKGRYPDGMCGIHTSAKNSTLPEEVLPEPKLNKLVVQKVSRVGIEGGPRVNFGTSQLELKMGVVTVTRSANKDFVRAEFTGHRVKRDGTTFRTPSTATVDYPTSNAYLNKLIEAILWEAAEDLPDLELMED